VSSGDQFGPKNNVRVGRQREFVCLISDQTVNRIKSCVIKTGRTSGDVTSQTRSIVIERQSVMKSTARLCQFDGVLAIEILMKIRSSPPMIAVSITR